MSVEIVPFSTPRGLATLAGKIPAVFLPNRKMAERFFDFFTSDIRNKGTRRAYYKASCRFAEWCEGRVMHDLAQVKLLHVAAYIELGKPTVSTITWRTRAPSRTRNR
jgi:hypothetical protein